MSKIMVAMSGGVDSSAAALILKLAGNETAGLTMKLHSFSNGTESEDAKTSADVIGIEHYTLNFEESFAEYVIKPFCNDYFAGRTPNPCIMCNKHIKFGAFYEKAAGLGYPDIATGHYARVERDGDRFLLRKAADNGKDQSYVLYNLEQKMLSHLFLPLGDKVKSELREMLREYGVPVADRPESQDICFVPDGDYAGFIRSYTGKTMPKGNFTDTGGKILGQHNGIMCYTPGQRRGLGVSADRRLYVLDKNGRDNTVILGDDFELFRKRIKINDLNLIAAETLNTPMRVDAKIRYSTFSSPATVHQISETEAVLEFDKPQRAPVCGQSAVFYDGEYVVGGGIISEILNEDC